MDKYKKVDNKLEITTEVKKLLSKEELTARKARLEIELSRIQSQIDKVDSQLLEATNLGL
jgi:uncharacterized small protein (DUF1192 family)